MTRRVSVILLAVLAFLLPLGASTPSTTTQVVLDEECLPHLVSCVLMDDPCAGLATPGAFVGIKTHATIGGRPAAFRTMHLEPGARTIWLDSRGAARVALAPIVGSSQATFRVGDATATASVTWSNTRADPLAQQQLPDEFAPALRFVSVTANWTHAPLAGAVVTVAASDGEQYASLPSNATGIAAITLPWNQNLTDSFPIVDVTKCGIGPGETQPSIDVTWRAPAQAPPPPSAPDLNVTLRVPVGWSRSVRPVVDVTNAQGNFTLFWRIDGLPWETGDIRVPSGQHELEAFASDASGRRSSIARATTLVDDAPPDVLAQTTEAWSTCRDAPWRVRDDLSGVSSVRVTLDGSTQSVEWDANGNVRLPLTEGAHDLTLTVTDAAGNQAVSQLRVRCDTTPPTVTPSWPTGWTRCPAGATWNATDATSGVDSNATRVWLDGVTTPPASNGTSISIEVPEGRHVVHVRIADLAANTADAGGVILCDRTAPTIGVELGGTSSGGYWTSPVHVKANASDAASGVASLLARSGADAWQDASDLVVTNDGPHVVDVRATDNAGNIAERTIDLTIDTTPPSLDAPSSIAPEAGTLFAVRAADDGSGLANVTLSGDGLDLGGASRGESTFVFTLPRAVHAPLRLVAVDRAGNVAARDVQLASRGPTPTPPPTAVVTPPTPPLPPSGMKVQSYAVAQVRGALRPTVQVSGIAQGARAGTATLIDSEDRVVTQSPLSFEDQLFTANLSAPKAGDYHVRLVFVAPDGTSYGQDTGVVHVENDATRRSVPLGALVPWTLAGAALWARRLRG